MAKSAKKSFKDSVDQHLLISKEITARRFAPMYLLMGDESYFIDQLTAQLSEQILTESERSFNQIVVYGKDAVVGAVINLCRQMPMMGSFQVVIVKEAQQLKGLDKLSLYAQSPSPSTILVLAHKEKTVDKRLALYKSIDDKGCVFESIRPRDYEIGAWLTGYIKSLGCTIDPRAQVVLTDYLGADIAKIVNELGKLLTYLPENVKQITIDHIEQNIGISKEFNNFELTRALSEKDIHKAMLIADHFARNPKDNPLLVTISSIFTHFQRIFILNYQRWVAKRTGRAIPSEMELSRMLKLPTPFFLKEYTQAANLYPNNKVFGIMGLLREYDLKSKGMNTGQASDGELLKELLLKIFAI